MVTLASVDFPYMAMHLDERLERLEMLAWRRSRQPPFQNLSNLSNLLTHPRRAQMKTQCGIVACLFMMARHGGIYHGKIPQFCQGAATCHISDMPQHHTSNQREISFYIFFHYIYIYTISHYMQIIQTNFLVIYIYIYNYMKVLLYSAYIITPYGLLGAT